MDHRKIGIIGGLSPESTISYYQHITRRYVAAYGDDSYPEILIYSVNLQKYHDWRDQGRWDLISAALAEAANRLSDAGAEFGLIATNTLHKVFDSAQEQSRLPLLHILDPVIEAIQTSGYNRVALLGTRFTMGEDFYLSHLQRHGVHGLVPSTADQQRIHDIIVTELTRGVLTEASRAVFLDVIGKLAKEGAQAVILGCTEIPLLVRPADCSLPLFDTAALHAEAALWQAVRGQTQIETPRLKLRQATLGDAPFLLELTRDPQYIANIRDTGLRHPQDARDYLERVYLASYRQHGHGLWMVEHKTAGTPIGICGLLYREAMQETDIGYAFLPAWHGQGYAFEAAQACMQWGRTTLGKQRIIGLCSPENQASARLLKKLGLNFQGMTAMPPHGQTGLFV